MNQAITAVKNGELKVSAAANHYQIPRKTLCRYLQKNTVEKRMGRLPELGLQHEKQLVEHLKNLCDHGFPLSPREVRTLAYKFCIDNKIACRFNEKKGMTGNDWLQGFLRRNKTLSKRVAEGLSSSRATGMNKTDVNKYFTILQDIFEKNNFMLKPERIYNADESGFQLNNKPGIVISEKGRKDDVSITSKEKGETVSVLVCCSATGHFIPPLVLMKGKRYRAEYSYGLPPGSQVKMTDSGYISTEGFSSFLNMFQSHTSSSKENPSLLVVDGHSTHIKDPDLLSFANDNGIIMICLPPHTTHWLQPLDRSIFKPMKCYYYEAVNVWVRNNPGQSLGKCEFGKLFNTAWGKSATPSNAANGFRACGLYPLDPDAVPNHAYLKQHPDQVDSSMISQTTDDNLMAQNDPGPSGQNTKDFGKLSPMPEMIQSTRCRRKTVSAEVTSTSYIENLRENENLKRKQSISKRNAFPKETLKKQMQEKKNTNTDSLCTVCNKFYSEDHLGEKWLQCIVIHGIMKSVLKHTIHVFCVQIAYK